MNVVIPMAGKSTAFKEAGIKTPKPFLDIKGKTMVQRAYENHVALAHPEPFVKSAFFLFS